MNFPSQLRRLALQRAAFVLGLIDFGVVVAEGPVVVCAGRLSEISCGNRCSAKRLSSQGFDRFDLGDAPTVGFAFEAEAQFLDVSVAFAIYIGDSGQEDR